MKRKLFWLSAVLLSVGLGVNSGQASDLEDMFKDVLKKKLAPPAQPTAPQQPVPPAQPVAPTPPVAVTQKPAEKPA